MATFWSAPTSKHAYILSWVSLIITILAAFGGIFIYVMSGSSLMLCFGLENCVDFMSSAVVLWRFYCPELNPEIEKRLQSREKRASMGISIILAVLGCGIIAAAADDFSKGMEEESKLRLVLGVSIVSLFIFGVLAIFKFHYSVLLNSASLHKDGICSLIGTILAGALFVNSLIIKHIPSAWWIDPAVAFGCGIASIGIGVWALIEAWAFHAIPIFSLSWWTGTDVESTPTESHGHTSSNPYPPNGGETEIPPKTSEVV